MRPVVGRAAARARGRRRALGARRRGASVLSYERDREVLRLPAAGLNGREPVEQLERETLAQATAGDLERDPEQPLDLEQDRDPGRQRAARARGRRRSGGRSPRTAPGGAAAAPREAPSSPSVRPTSFFAARAVPPTASAVFGSGGITCSNAAAASRRSAATSSLEGGSAAGNAGAEPERAEVDRAQPGRPAPRRCRRRAGPSRRRRRRRRPRPSGSRGRRRPRRRAAPPRPARGRERARRPRARASGRADPRCAPAGRARRRRRRSAQRPLARAMSAKPLRHSDASASLTAETAPLRSMSAPRPTARLPSATRTSPSPAAGGDQEPDRVRPDVDDGDVHLAGILPETPADRWGVSGEEVVKRPGRSPLGGRRRRRAERIRIAWPERGCSPFFGTTFVHVPSGLQLPGGRVLEQRVERRAEADLEPRILDGRDDLEPVVEVPRQEVGAADEVPPVASAPRS